MTVPIHPSNPTFTDEAAVRGELVDAFSVCNECRRCVDRCASFPTLFDMLDASADTEAGDMTPAQQDRVVDGCVHCNMCTATCPYGPGRHELELDFAALMLRATAMRRHNGHVSATTRLAARTMGRTAQVGRLAVRVPRVANRLLRAAPGSLVRRIVARALGVSAGRRIAPFAAERFSTWFVHRPRITIGRSQRSAAFLPTCVIEFQKTSVGKDLVKVFERNGVECSVSGVRCCGAPLLHAGDVDGFAAVATKNVRTLAAEVGDGNDVVVGQPGCLSMLRTEYARVVAETDLEAAELVAENSHDPAEYLMAVHRSDDAVLDTDFHGSIPDRVAFHSACHLRALGIGFAGRDLMRLTGARVEVIQQCSGIDGIWGLRAGNDEVATAMADRLVERVERSRAQIVAADCLLSGDVVTDRTDRSSTHPIEVLARAYGIPVER